MSISVFDGLRDKSLGPPPFIRFLTTEGVDLKEQKKSNKVIWYEVKGSTLVSALLKSIWKWISEVWKVVRTKGWCRTFSGGERGLRRRHNKMLKGSTVKDRDLWDKRVSARNGGEFRFEFKVVLKKGSNGSKVKSCLNNSCRFHDPQHGSQPPLVYHWVCVWTEFLKCWIIPSVTWFLLSLPFVYWGNRWRL